jgi:hypothetical protein
MKTFLSTVALTALLCAAGSARAQDADDAEVTRMAKEHYKSGLEAYKAGKYEIAIKELKKAYLLKRLPALLLNIGATYRKMGDYDLALHFYQKYLDEAPPDAKDRGEVQGIIAEVQKEKAGGGAPPPADTNTQVAPPPSETEAPPPPRHVEKAIDMPKEFSHTPVDAAPPDQPIDVRVSMPVMKGVKVYVFYRVAGQADFTQVLMKRRGREKVGRIPGEAVGGKALQYYVEARDPAGSVVKSSGSPSDPNVIMIDANAPSQVLASVDASHDAEGGEGGEQPKATGHNLDDEAAPMTGQLKDKPATKTKRASSSSGSGSSGGFTGLFWGGVIVAGIGVACVVVGAVGLAQASSFSDTVGFSSRNPVDSNGNPIFFNNDPNAGGAPQFAAQQDQGKLWNSIGIAFTTIGAIATVAGGIVAIIGATSGGKRKEQPKRAISRFFITPTIVPAGGQRQAGVLTGFSF